MQTARVKPSARNFDYMIEKMAEIGVRKEKILHTAESMFCSPIAVFAPVLSFRYAAA